MRNLLADFADSIFDRIDYTLEGLGVEELHWKPVEKSNTIYWILTHTTRIAYLLIPQVITQTYNPEGWDDDYEKQKHTLEELRHDLREGRKLVVSGIKELDPASLSEEIYIWGKNRPLKEPIFVLLGELLHHNGQIALLRGIYKRTRAD
ncbi:DinB family protein [Candidatus Bathyarchaeota archaeon]|nr:DinB family protein [Candidatus Bathyarchaeota archaeon]